MGAGTWFTQWSFCFSICPRLDRAASIEKIIMQKQNLQKEAEQVMKNADLLFSSTEVENAIDCLAVEISAKLYDKNPLLLCVMTGGIIPAGMLIPKLEFPLELDYIHATRYRGKTSGSSIQWLKKPDTSLAERTILLIDDILDEGITLATLIQYCKEQGASEVYSAVLVDKQLNRQRAMDKADFTGLEIPDRYVFGYGMDYKGYLRNAHGIYAVKGM